MNQVQELNNLIKICQLNLKNSRDCINYLVKERGLDKKTILENKIGFFPQNISILKKHVSCRCAYAKVCWPSQIKKVKG